MEQPQCKSPGPSEVSEALRRGHESLGADFALVTGTDQAAARCILEDNQWLLEVGCGLLLTEVVLYDRKTKPCRALLQNLSLMMESEGKERSGSEYRKLLHNHGFTNVHIKHTGTFLDVIFCTKK